MRSPSRRLRGSGTSWPFLALRRRGVVVTCPQLQRRPRRSFEHHPTKTTRSTSSSCAVQLLGTSATAAAGGWAQQSAVLAGCGRAPRSRFVILRSPLGKGGAGWKSMLRQGLTSSAGWLLLPLPRNLLWKKDIEQWHRGSAPQIETIAVRLDVGQRRSLLDLVTGTGAPPRTKAPKRTSRRLIHFDERSFWPV